jgi:class 3 adenylate cyclase
MRRTDWSPGEEAREDMYTTSFLERDPLAEMFTADRLSDAVTFLFTDIEGSTRLFKRLWRPCQPCRRCLPVLLS